MRPAPTAPMSLTKPRQKPHPPSRSIYTLDPRALHKFTDEFASSQPEQVCRSSHKRKSTSQEQDAQESSCPGTRLKKRADTRLRANTRTDTFPPKTSLTQNNDAQQITLLPTSDTTLPQPTKSTDFVCLSNQDSIALSRNRRCAQRPQRLCHSPSRGRSRIHPQPETPKDSPRPIRTRRPPNRTSPPPQLQKRQKSKQGISQDAPNPPEDMILPSAPLLCTEQQSGLPFDRGKN